MGRNVVESVMGAVVLLVAGLFVYFAWNTAQIRAVPGYEVSAAFYKIGGLADGSDVRIAGIRSAPSPATTSIQRRLTPWSA